MGWRGCRIPSGPVGEKPRPAFIGRDSARETARHRGRGRGCRQEGHRRISPAKRRRRGGGPAEVRRLERGRQRRGNKFPLPVSLSPNGDIHHGPAHGEILERNRARWPTDSTPDTASHQVSPRTDPAPGRGRGRSAAGAGGVGVPRQKSKGIPHEGAGGVGVPRQKSKGIPTEARVGWGGRRSARVSLRRRGRGGGRWQKCTGIPTEARVGWGVPARYPGIPHEGAGRIGLAKSKVSGA